MNKKDKLILCVSLILVFIIMLYFIIGEYLQNNQKGLRIDKEYIKSVTGQEAFVNDVYVTMMTNFVDKCGKNNTLRRFNDIKGNLYGITLWCKDTQEKFTFFYSDKWRQEQYGKK